MSLKKPKQPRDGQKEAEEKKGKPSRRIEVNPDLLVDPAGEGSKKALEVMRNQMIHQERSLNIEEFQLYDLGFMKNQAWVLLEEIQLNRNMIANIDILNQYQHLVSVDASHCFIQEVNFSLPRLEYLNLSNNYLSKFPILEGMQRLNHLNLNSNKITDFKSANIKFTLHIEHLDLGRNRMAFDSKYDFVEFLHKLQKLAKLKSLDVDENPFFETENLKMFAGLNIKDEMVKTLTSLQTFNGDDMHTVKKQIKKAQIEDEIKDQNIFAGSDQIMDTEASEKEMTKRKKNKALPPSLDSLLESLESANGQPSFALEHLKDLSQAADRVVEKLDLIESTFALGKSEEEIEEMTETFMQNA